MKIAILNKGVKLAAIAGLSLYVVTSYAEERVINDSLVYNDPTVAKKDSSIIGVSIDRFSMNASAADTSGTSTGGGTYTTTNRKETTAVPGVSLWWGTGNWSVIGSYRSGDRTSGYDYHPSTGSSFHVDETGTRKEMEVNVRYMLSDLQTDYFIPFVVVGMAQIDFTTYTNLPSINYTQNSTSKASLQVYGVGAIIPVTAAWGARFDIKSSAVNTNFSYTSTSSGTVSSGSNTSTFKATRYTLAGYYNFTPAINLQAGLRKEVVDSDTFDYLYTSLGYTFR